MPKNDKIEKVYIRMPATAKAQLEAIARRENRSVSAQASVILQKELERIGAAA